MIWLCVKGVGILSSSFANKWEFQPFDKEQFFLFTTVGQNSKREVQKNISKAAEEKKSP